MAIISLPDEELFCPQEFHIQVRGNIQVNVSPLNGATQTVEMPGDRMVFTLIYGPHHSSDMPRLRAFWNRFRGQAHILRLWNLAQPVPNGTLRGTPTVFAAVLAGASNIAITGATGSTLQIGDWVGIRMENSELQTVEVVTTAGTGTISIGFNPPLRRNVAAGAEVIWDHPWIDCLLSAPPVIPHGPGSANQLGISDGFTVEAVEFIT